MRHIKDIIYMEGRCKIMKIIAINGGPRKKWNTATLLENALKGAASRGAQTEMVHLYDLSYKGCISCFSCKEVGGKSYGKCILKDDLTPILRKIKNSDAFIIGSPVYLGDVTGALRCFLERLLFQYLVYDKNHSSLLKKKIPSAFIYTMNVDECNLEKVGYKEYFRKMQEIVERIFGPTEELYSTDTLQFSDYSRYVSTLFDSEKKMKRHREVFPKDCRRAYELGEKLAESRK